MYREFATQFKNDILSEKAFLGFIERRLDYVFISNNIEEYF